MANSAWIANSNYENSKFLSKNDENMNFHENYEPSQIPRFEGSWSKNQKHGACVFTYEDGATFKGLFSMDVLNYENSLIFIEKS